MLCKPGKDAERKRLGGGGQKSEGEGGELEKNETVVIAIIGCTWPGQQRVTFSPKC